VWDLASGELLATFAFPSDICAVTMDPVEEYVYVGCGDGRIHRASLRPKIEGSAILQQVKVGASDGTFLGHTLAVTCLTVSFDGCSLVSGSEDGTVRVWDTGSLQCIRMYDHKGPVTCVTLVPRSWVREKDGKDQMALVGSNFERRLYTPSTGMTADPAACVETKLQTVPGSHPDDPMTAVATKLSASDYFRQDMQTLVGNSSSSSGSGCGGGAGGGVNATTSTGRVQSGDGKTSHSADERAAMQAEITRLTAENAHWKEAAQALYTEATSAILSNIPS
jgi:WD40 repeat protein